MVEIINILWLVPVLPLISAALLVFAPKLTRSAASGIAIGSLSASFIISVLAFFRTLSPEFQELGRQFVNVPWLQMGTTDLKIGWLLDPLNSAMLLMVTFVGTLIFIFSRGYMEHDERYNRFFCYLSLFASAMLGIIISNSLLLLFICWELVGLASYLLIGFWAHKPSATAAAKKAFITTRIGDIGFFIGMLWLFQSAGTLLFYDGGNGCLETSALTLLGTQVTILGLALSTAITLFILWGAMGKSGQFPLHVWLPDAMEGPTPVSALIHAATMVAAGVFLMARLFPLREASVPDTHGHGAGASGSLVATAWIGAITALLGALIAVGQSDIKRILAYSTVSQLGYMMLGLGTGGPAVAMFHLITHAFFKALLFLGAGSVIHGCHEVQDIRRMGGLRKVMPITFATYAIGMLALSGFPLLFAGFWSKDAILHSAHVWEVSQVPFFMGLAGAFLTAFYMTRQMGYVFFGSNRLNTNSTQPKIEPHESPAIMTWPLIMLAIGAILLGFLGTPAFPVFQGYLNADPTEFSFGELFHGDALVLMGVSAVLALGGIALGWKFYGEKSFNPATQEDPVQKLLPRYFGAAGAQFWFDQFYEATVIRGTRWTGIASDFLDRQVFQRVVAFCSLLVKGLSYTTRFADEHLVNGLFDLSCREINRGGRLSSSCHRGQVQGYLRLIAASLLLLTVLIIWSSRS